MRAIGGILNGICGLMIVCSNCEISEAEVQCEECSINNIDDNLFCVPCGEIHLNIRKYRNHTCKSIDKSVQKQNCTNCEFDPATFHCLDCLSEESFYCSDCSKLHLKVKLTRGHRIIPVIGITRDNTGNICASQKSLNNLGEGLMANSGCSSSFLNYFENIFDFMSEFKSTEQASDYVHLCYNRCMACIDTTEIYDMLVFFDFDVLFDKLPLPRLFLGIAFIVSVACMFLSDLTTNSGSSAAFVIGVIAFLRFMQYRKGLKIKHRLRAPTGFRARKPLLRSTSSPLPAPTSMARNHYQKGNSLRQVRGINVNVYVDNVCPV